MSKRFGSLLLVAAGACLLSGCGIGKERQENEQLKAQVAELQKDLGDMGNRVDAATKDKDDLLKQNAVLKHENDRLKEKRRGARQTKPKRRRRRAA
jgi:hypothetical protein